MGMAFSRTSMFDEPVAGPDGLQKLPWMEGTTEYSIAQIKHMRGAKPGELQHPALKHCRETRMHRNTCLNHAGSCEYKIEAHFKCLEQYYPKEKVQKYRESFADSSFDNYQYLDNLMARAPFYYMNDYAPNDWTPSTRA